MLPVSAAEQCGQRGTTYFSVKTFISLVAGRLPARPNTEFPDTNGPGSVAAIVVISVEPSSTLPAWRPGPGAPSEHGSLSSLV